MFAFFCLFSFSNIDIAMAGGDLTPYSPAHSSSHHQTKKCVGTPPFGSADICIRHRAHTGVPIFNMYGLNFK